MAERKLAHIEQIEWIRPIKDADRIVTYGILGWEVVDQKGKYNINDKVIYCEVDSVLPEKPEYEFLRDRKFRVRTIRLKSQVSQGLILPIPDSWKYMSDHRHQLGADVTELLGITKYLSPSERTEIEQLENSIKLEKSRLKKFLMRYSFFRRLFLSKKGKSEFPYWVSKTDEERIQNIPYVLEQFKDKEVYVTEKIDYQSGTWTGKMVPRWPWLQNIFPKFYIMYGSQDRYLKKYSWLDKLSPKRFQFVVCSRNLTTNDKNSLYWRIAKKYNLEQILRANPTLTIQGEQGNTNVQGNKYAISGPEMWVFNIIDHEENRHYGYGEMKMFCDRYKLNVVSVLWHNGKNGWKQHMIPLSELGSTVQELVEFSKGKSVINPTVEREGIVVRCIENGKKLLSFKVINPNFLLKYSDE